MTSIKHLTSIYLVFASAIALAIDTPFDELSSSKDNINATNVQKIDRYKHPEAAAREKEIKDLKCTICQTRCKLVYKAGTSTCQTSNGRVIAGCQEKGENFVNQCLKQCSEC